MTGSWFSMAVPLVRLYLRREVRDRGSGRFGMDKRRELRDESLSHRRCSGALDDFTVRNALAVQRLVAGIIWFQGSAVEIETGEGSLGVAEKQNLRIGITVGGLSIYPRSRSIRADR